VSDVNAKSMIVVWQAADVGGGGELDSSCPR
jgi:hypothetical protein